MTGENNLRIFNNKLFRKKMEFDLFVNSVITASLFSERERESFPQISSYPITETPYTGLHRKLFQGAPLSGQR